MFDRHIVAWKEFDVRGVGMPRKIIRVNGGCWEDREGFGILQLRLHLQLRRIGRGMVVLLERDMHL